MYFACSGGSDDAWSLSQSRGLRTTALLQMTIVLRLGFFCLCKLGRLKSPMVKEEGVSAVKEEGV